MFIVVCVFLLFVHDCVDGMKHPMKKVVRWSQVIVKMSNIVTIIDDHVDKLLLQRKNNKPNAMQLEGKIIRLAMILILMTNSKGACVTLIISNYFVLKLCSC